jgi:beta-galactosidase
MKNKTNKQESKKSRRTFLQSMGVAVAGFSMLPSFLLSNSRNFRTGNTALPINQSADTTDVLLPDGVSAIWDISKAYHETTSTRERICINGLWKWQPGTAQSEELPTANWGYFKVPGCWPGISNFMQKESQQIFAHGSWNNKSLNSIGIAWYQREISVPKNWINRRIILNVDYLNSSAIIFVNGVRLGEILFPSGELNLTSVCSPGKKYLISMKVTALPLSDVVAVYNDSNASRQGHGQVERRGLCGDVYLCSEPLKARINDVKVITSFRKGEITFNSNLENLSAGTTYSLNAVITNKGNKITEFKSKTFTSNDIKDGIFSLTEQWKPDKLWDVHTAENMFEFTLSLLERGKKVLDTSFPSRFGFREFWIEGRDFYLNDTRIYLSAVPFDNAQVGASLSTYEAAKESMRRLISFGINFVYTHNYGCEPGSHLSFEEILRAADDTGMLIALSQPHFGQYDWTAADADEKNGYAHHANFYTQVAHNHPSVVFYSMSHNGCGYNDDMNPDMIDGLSRPDNTWSANNAKKALRTEAIVARLDPSRIIYHHSSGNLSSMHTINFYPNWVPVQEMCDWFQHWATVGVKPVFLCEYAAPFSWDWSMYRGWYKGKREFGGAPVPWEFCMAEWNAQFLGDKAFQISEFEKVNLRWEAKQFQSGAVWHRWDYPYNFGDSLLEERNPVLTMHLVDQWRAFRTWGLSANSPWDYSFYWKLRKGAETGRKNLVIDWENLQRPGLSPDFYDRANRMDLDTAFDQSDWIPTAAEALMKNNMPLLAYIGGKSAAFTSKDHNFLPGTKFEKQLIIINNSRMNVTCECSWSLNLPEKVKAGKVINLVTGQQERILLNFELPDSLSPGIYELRSAVKFSNGETREDSFVIHVLPSLSLGKSTAKTALFDPKGETRQLLDEMGIQYQLVDEGTRLAGYDLLILGKEALTVQGPGLDAENVRNGLKIIVFEQTSEVLEKRFGFRVQEYGLRRIFKRMSDHPALTGLDSENLRDWQGAATLLPQKLKYEMNDNVFNGAPTVRWCDIPVTRIWRSGNRGNVASVIIEKPACGDFRPVVDGGYSLQYSPLMEYREGKGLVMFCQMDVTGRTEKDPAAWRLAGNIISYVSEWKPEIKRQAFYAGDKAGKSQLEKAGLSVSTYENKKLSPEQVLIVGPGGRQSLMSNSKDIAKWITAGGHLLAIGLDQEDVDALLPFKIGMRKEEHISAFFEALSINSPFAGIGPSDIHNRAPKELSLVSTGAMIVGNGILAKADNTNVVFCQSIPWQCDYSKEQHNVKQTYRRSSFLLSRLTGNLGVESTTVLLDRFNKPLTESKTEKRWLDGLYLDQPEEWDDPYRFFRW